MSLKYNIYLKMDKEIVKKYIKEVNKWWMGPFNFADYKERGAYYEIFKFMKEKQIIAITGLRRVGKTTLMLKIIKEYIGSGFVKENIFYFSFDEYSSSRIQEIIDIYFKLHQKNKSEGSFLFVFDEIQKVKNWEEQIKVIYDLNPNIKFLISGSESLFIRRKSRESLAGRIFEFKINPLSFNEYLSFIGKNYEKTELYKEEILKEFSNFLLCNGLPEMINKEKEIIIKYIQEGIIDKIIFRDMVEVFEIKNIEVMKSIFYIIYNNPGQIIEINNLSRDIGVSRQLISEYLEYLEESYLIKKLYNYSKNARKTQRRLKKYYAVLINPLLINDEFSHIFEQFMVLQLDAEFFWRDSYKNEVDIVKISPLEAIEIKSGDVKNSDLRPIEVFKNNFEPKEAFILSYDMEKEIDGIKVIPFYKYLIGSGK